jgi:hypothetical protein
MLCAFQPVGIPRSKSRSLVSPIFVSVSGGGGPSFPKKPENNFIISPVSTTSEAEMIIMDNFNSIQLGGSRKLAVIGTQTLTEKHVQMIELLSYALVKQNLSILHESTYAHILFLPKLRTPEFSILFTI